MQRRNFLLTSALAAPTIASAKLSEFTEERTEKGFVVKANESRFHEKTMVNGKNPNNIKVSTKDTNGQLSVFEYVGNEKGGPPLHIHPNQDEIFFVVSGEYLFQVGEEKYTLKGGDTIFLPRKVPHTFAQTSDKGQMFFLFQPSGKMEDFFRSIGTIKGEPSPQEGAKLFTNHDMQVVGPPLEY
ncbi:cupin domain-containing protein [Emticicia sp. C21]|uniref:cupin domain-containing protein n=1 Tax=Emticicia sp. C21 TaxID=2302915 RepID=UPI000E355F16|nr:cupin domain-containing protein [Emticicia sp. C21]RFS16634.1 cupin domain-containing protein [Emticicia sp. C21]